MKFDVTDVLYEILCLFVLLLDFCVVYCISENFTNLLKHSEIFALPLVRVLSVSLFTPGIISFFIQRFNILQIVCC